MRHNLLASTGGLTGLRRYAAESTGFAEIGDEEELNLFLKAQAGDSDETLMAMQEHYGQENLEKMKPSEFYRLYKDYALAKQQ